MDNDLNSEERVVLLGMEFIKQKDGKYLVVNSNGLIVNEKEKLQLENEELILKDIKGCDCQKETTKKISKNKKRIKEIETALNDEVQNDTIKETDTTI